MPARRPPRGRRIDRWKFAVLMYPLVRSVFLLSGLVPASGGQIPQRSETIATLAIGAAAAISLAGTVLRRDLIERVGLLILAPSVVIYGAAITAVAWRIGLLALIVYGLIAYAAASRAREIGNARELELELLAAHGDREPKP